MSPSLKRHLADLNLAVLDYPTYRIPVSGTEGCFNDLGNDHPATLYLWVAGSAVSCLLGFWLRSQCHSVAGTSTNFLSALSVNLSRTARCFSSPSPDDLLCSPPPLSFPDGLSWWADSVSGTTSQLHTIRNLTAWSREHTASWRMPSASGWQVTTGCHTSATSSSAWEPHPKKTPHLFSWAGIWCQHPPPWAAPTGSRAANSVILSRW